MRIFGLTGGIGSGKTEVASHFANSGIPTFDADHAARAARDVGSPIAGEILQAFRTLDPREISRLTFEGPEAMAYRTRLESIVIPFIHQQFDLWQKAHERYTVGIYEASLLVEKKRAYDFSGIIVVVAPLEQRIARLKQRGLSDAQIAGRMAAQVSDEDRQRVATHVILNDGSLDSLKAQVADLAKVLQAP